MGQGLDPVKEGFAESLARPGGNVTGFTNFSRELGGKRWSCSKKPFPNLSVSRFSTIRPFLHFTRGERGSPSRGAWAGLTVQSWEVRDAAGFEKVFAGLSKERPDGLYAPGGGPIMTANRKRIAGFALKSRLPSMCNNRESVDAGGLMSYSADPAESYRRVAYYVDRILKGAKPADLPVEQPTKFELVINLNEKIRRLRAEELVGR
jgi:putative tryptophan/tyrosine transport system substrate-binding protein